MREKRKKKPPQFNYLLPPEEVLRIYDVLGGKPGLDPCGHPDQFLEAEKVMYGTAPEDDGFQAVWRNYKTVVLNAPHGEREPDWDGIEADHPNWQRPDWPWHPFSRWITKASIEATNGATVLAFMPAATDRKWFHQYVSEANSIALLEQRVKCYVPTDGEPERGPQPMNAHMLVLWTSDNTTADRFYETYKTRGMIVEPRPVQT
jgi:hypothetical protein